MSSPEKSRESEVDRNFCVKCGVDMGPQNPRQLCGKTVCHNKSRYPGAYIFPRLDGDTANVKSSIEEVDEDDMPFIMEVEDSPCSWSKCVECGTDMGDSPEQLCGKTRCLMN